MPVLDGVDGNSGLTVSLATRVVIIAIRDAASEVVGRVEIASMPFGETPRAISSHPNRSCSMQPPELA